MTEDTGKIAGLAMSDVKFDAYEPRIKIVPSNDEGWTRVVFQYDGGSEVEDYWVEVARRIDSGYVKYDDERSGVASVAVPVGYELYSYRYEELSQNGVVTYSVVATPPDAVRVTYHIKSEGDFVDRRRGWLSLRVILRGRLLSTQN